MSLTTLGQKQSTLIEVDRIDQLSAKMFALSDVLDLNNVVVSAQQLLQDKIPLINLEGFNLTLQHNIQSLKGRHVTFGVKYHEVTLFRSQVKINTDLVGNIISVSSNLSDFLAPKQGEFPTENFIPELLLQLGLNQHTPHEKNKVWYFDGAQTIPALRLHVCPNHDFHYEFIIGENGAILYRNDLNCYFGPDSTITGTVFMPDPLTTAGVEYGGLYIDSTDLDVQVLNNEIQTVSTTCYYDETDSLYKLQNDYLIISEFSPPVIQPVTSDTAVFSFTRTEDGFEDINAYYHLTFFHDYIWSLGFSNIVNYQIRIDTHGKNGADNSTFNYFDNPPTIAFGEGGVDDAEDTDVIVHEYGHAISYSAAPGTNYGSQRQAVDEANGDYFASSYSKMMNDHNWDHVFSWDGHNEFWPGRFSTSTDHYPEDVFNNLYADADIWSSTIMQINDSIGRDVTMKILIESMYSYFSNFTMSNAASHFLSADLLLNNGTNEDVICYWFTQRGLLSDCMEEPPTFPVDTIPAIIPDTTQELHIILTEGFGNGTGPVQIRFDLSTDFEFDIYDGVGKLVDRIAVKNSAKYDYYGEKLNAGGYFLRLNSSFENRTVPLLRIAPK